MRTNIFDSMNRIIGYTLDDGPRIRVFDGESHYKGYYEKASNKTFGEFGNYVGRGNLLMMLLGGDDKPGFSNR